MFKRKAVSCLIGGLFVLWGTVGFAVQPLEIKSVIVDEAEDGSVTLMVYGENLMNGSDLELWLGEILLDVDLNTLTNTSVHASVPEQYLPIMDGSYQLVATTGGGTVRFNDFDGVTIGAEGLQGEQGLPGVDGIDGAPGIDGADGAPGPKGDKGDTGDTGSAGSNGANGQDGVNCYDGIGDSIADCIGSQGEQGPEGLQGPRGEQGPAGPGAPKMVVGRVDSRITSGIVYDMNGYNVCRTDVGDFTVVFDEPFLYQSDVAVFVQHVQIALDEYHGFYGDANSCLPFSSERTGFRVKFFAATGVPRDYVFQFMAIEYDQ